MANRIDISGKTENSANSNDNEINELFERLNLFEQNNFDYEILTKTVQAGITKHILDDKFTCYYGNEYFFFMIGYTEEEFGNELNSSVETIVDPEDLKQFRKELDYCIKNNISNFYMNFRITRKEGYRLFFKTSVSVFRDEKTNEYHFYCVHTDITTSVINEQIANRKMHLLENVCNSMMTAIAIMEVNESDMKMRVVYANPSAVKIFGIPEKEYRKENFEPISLAVYDDIEYVKDVFYDVVKYKKSVKMEARAKSPDGTPTQWIYANIKPAAQSRNGKVTVLVEIENITERHQLRVENEYILENMPGFMAKYVIEKTGPRLIEANSKFYEFFGTSKEEYEQKGVYYINHYNNEIEAKVNENFDKIRSGMSVSFEYRTVNAEGNLAWIRLQGTCMGFEKGNPVYLIVQHDITDMKNLETQLTEEKERYRIAYKNSKTTMFEYNIKEDALYYFGREENEKGESSVTVIKNYIGSGVLSSDTYPADRDMLVSFFKGELGKTIKVRRNAQRLGYNGYEWVELNASPLYDGDETPIKIIGTFQMIGEQDNSIYEKIETLVKENPYQRYAIIRMDIDNFKMINDLYGWKEGDKVLSFIANSLRDVVPDNKYPVGRITSDIFCMCVPYVDETNIQSIVTLTMMALKDYPTDLGLSAHFGVYITDENSVNTPATIMFDRANLALKTVKDRVSPIHAFFDKNLRDTLLNEQMIERDMHNALETNQFIPYFQPKYNISTGKVIGAEALVRWIHPEKGIIPPNSFIPLFERNGFIINVDEYIWEEVCKRMAGWRDKGYEVIPVSVNVSRLHIFDPNFTTKIKNLVKKYDITPDMLILEFTESLLLENAEEMLKMMNDLRNEGFLISMDDFGSGFSSLNMLKDMPLNEVKIDKEFLNETQSTNAAKGKTVVAGTILMVNQLDMGVIAEGVENHEQAQFLLAAGCNTAQGFYYSRPIPPNDFEKLVFGTEPV